MESVIEGLSYFFWVAIALGILVLIHELGHFLTARMFGMRVDAFSLGMPPNVLKKRFGDTEYRLGALPLGGYVSIAGMVDESMRFPYEMEPVLDDRGDPVFDDDGEPLMREVLDEYGKRIPADLAPEPDEFRAKPVWQRMIVISAGVVFNVILAFLIYSAISFTYGRTYTPAENVSLTVEEGSIADELGIESGDRIVAFDDEPLESLSGIVLGFVSGSETITVQRDGREVALDIPSGMMTKMSRASRETGDDNPLAMLGLSEQLPAVLSAVSSGSAAEDVGIRAGDRITRLGGEPVRLFGDLTALVAATEGEATTIEWTRPVDAVDEDDPEPVRRTAEVAVYQAEITPKPSGDRLLIGVAPDASVLGTKTETLGLGEAVQAGAQQTTDTIGLYVGLVARLFSGDESLKDNLGGPLEIAKQSKESADRGGPSFWLFVAFLSIALAVFNILPIPALDGGHIMFLIYEAVARREPSLKVRMVVQQIGLAMILVLMVFVIFNDALRLFG